MSSRRFDNASLNVMSSSVLPAAISYAATFPQGHTLEAGTISPEMEWPEQTVVDIRSLGRGVRWALTIEGAAALCLYAIWHLLRLWL